jgi:hypothetical protein
VSQSLSTTSSTSSFKDDLEDLEEKRRYEEKHGSGPAAKKPKGKGLKGGIPVEVGTGIILAAGITFFVAWVALFVYFVALRDWRNRRLRVRIAPLQSSPPNSTFAVLEGVAAKTTDETVSVVVPGTRKLRHKNRVSPVELEKSESNILDIPLHQSESSNSESAVNELLEGSSAMAAGEVENTQPASDLKSTETQYESDDEKKPLLMPTEPSSHEEVHDTVSGVNRRANSVKVPLRRLKKYKIIVGVIIGLVVWALCSALRSQ